MRIIRYAKSILEALSLFLLQAIVLRRGDALILLFHAQFNTYIHECRNRGYTSTCIYKVKL